jgi:hypothetical protein
MKFLFQILSLAALAGYAAADIVVDNEIINPDDIYDIVYSEDSDENWKSVNTKKYYCMYRNLWTKIDHPVQYPQFARLSSVIMYSSTTGFLPWLRTRSTTVGVELLAEVSSSLIVPVDYDYIESLARIEYETIHIPPTANSHPPTPSPTSSLVWIQWKVLGGSHKSRNSGARPMPRGWLYSESGPMGGKLQVHAQSRSNR